MKSIFTISFFITLLFTAGTAFSYQCDIPPAPPKIQPCTCSQYQKQCPKPQCNLQYRCGTCKKKCSSPKKPCKKSIVKKNSYQCETTCTTKTEHITTVKCKLCGTYHPRGVDHYCNKVQCKSCGKIHPRAVNHRCNTKPHCEKIQCRSCGIYYHPQIGHHCPPHRQHYDCSEAKPCRNEGKQCSTLGSTLSHETHWDKWFKNQG